MKKKTKIIINIFYYLLTFGLGFLLAVILPSALENSNIPKYVDNYLADGRYEKAMELVGGYFNSKEVYKYESDDYKLVIFESLTIQVSDDNKDRSAHLSYSMFLYGIKDKYLVKSNDEKNPTKLLIDEDDNKVVKLIDYDSDNDGNKDSISTLINLNFMYVEINKDKIPSINKIEFIDRYGDVKYSADNLNLNYDTEFYKLLTESDNGIVKKSFIEDYNQREMTEEEYNKFTDYFKSKNENYKVGTDNDVKNDSTRDAVWIIVIYYVCIYVFGDLVLGFRLLLKPFIFIKKKFKKQEDSDEVEVVEEKENFDYFTTFIASLSKPIDENINISIHYHNETDEINILLTKENEYSFKARVHAGIYYNLKFEAVGYKANNLPAELKVKGYKMQLVIDVEKIKE